VRFLLKIMLLFITETNVIPYFGDDPMIRLATAEDAPLVYQIMMSAYAEYRSLPAPSGALRETESAIKASLQNGSEQALLYYEGSVPVGSVRFKTDGDSLYFCRLSVCPEARGRGVAKAMLAWLENYANTHGLKKIWCKVRASIPRNVRLYQSAGFRICGEEVKFHPNGIPLSIIIMEKEINQQIRQGNPY